MLEVIESDFARLEADTKAAEASAQKEYDTFMTDSKVDKSAKSTDIEHKTAKKQDESQALTVKREDLEGTQKELDAALAYFDKLKPSCVDSGVSYEDTGPSFKRTHVDLYIYTCFSISYHLILSYTFCYCCYAKLYDF